MNSGCTSNSQISSYKETNVKNSTIFVRASGIAAIVTTLVTAQDLHTIFPSAPALGVYDCRKR